MEGINRNAAGADRGASECVLLGWDKPEDKHNSKSTQDHLHHLRSVRPWCDRPPMFSGLPPQARHVRDVFPDWWHAQSKDWPKTSRHAEGLLDGARGDDVPAACREHAAAIERRQRESQSGCRFIPLKCGVIEAEFRPAPCSYPLANLRRAA